jgi:hypothetical protein
VLLNVSPQVDPAAEEAMQWALDVPYIFLDMSRSVTTGKIPHRALELLCLAVRGTSSSITGRSFQEIAISLISKPVR